MALFGTKILVTAIYNAYFHPLSKFPGPKWAAATPVPFVFNQTKGHMVNWAMKLHAKYGEIVRIGPEELSFIGSGAWQDIYMSRPQLPKTSKGTVGSYNGTKALATETDTEVHTRQRRILSHAFSDRALRQQEDILKHYTDLLINKLHAQVKSSGTPSAVVDITRWYNFTTFDTIGDLLFNDPFHSLENSDDHPWVAAVFNGVKYQHLLTGFHFFPPMASIVSRMMPKSLREKARQHFEWSHDKITKRIQSETKRPDFLTFILGNNDGNEKMTRDEIDSNGSFLILAGSETSATTCSSSTFFLLKHPNVYGRLVREIREAFKSIDDITVTTAAQLPYLHAVIVEALRLHPTGPVAVPRVVDRSDVYVCGRLIPEGVCDYWACGLLHRDFLAYSCRRVSESRRKPCFGRLLISLNRTRSLRSGGLRTRLASMTRIEKRCTSHLW